MLNSRIGVRVRIVVIGILAALGTITLVALNHQFMVYEGRGLPYGSRLISQSYVPTQKVFPRVLFLGNSVLQYSPLIEEIRRARNLLDPRQKFEVINYGAVGASIADLLLIYEWARAAHPDLVVVELTPHIFFSGEPLLRTDIKGMIFQPEFWRLASLQPIRQAYTRNEWADALVYSFFAPIRFLPILRDELKTWVYGLGFKVTDFFPWRLNRAEEWRTALPPASLKRMYESAEEYSGSEVLLKALLNRIQEDRVPILFVIQERDKPLYPVESKLKGWSADQAGVKTLDLSSYFKLEEMPDHIHFNQLGARQSAARILPTLLEMLSHGL